MFFSNFQGRIDMITGVISASKPYVNMISISILSLKSKDSSQVRFFLDNASYFFVKPQSPLLHYYLSLPILNDALQISAVVDKTSF